MPAASCGSWAVRDHVVDLGAAREGNTAVSARCRCRVDPGPPIGSAPPTGGVHEIEPRRGTAPHLGSWPYVWVE